MVSIKFPAENPCDFFIFSGDESRFENLLEYKKNGLHPTIIGDILPKQSTCITDPVREPRYRIIHKIGMGAFALVWLAYDLVDSGYVAIKISRGAESACFTRERDILWNIHAERDINPGRERIIKLLDSFIIRGPNGFHECLVTEVIIPLNKRFVGDVSASHIVPQMLEGFMFLHEQGIIHGDPHPGNIGLAVPHLNQLSEDEILEYFSIPETIPVVPRRSSFPMETIPPYIVETVSIASFIKDQGLPKDFQTNIKILDFGRAFRADEVAVSLPGAVPEMFCAPEFMLQTEQDKVHKRKTGWSKEADIWAVGCMLCNILCQAELIRDWQPTNSKLVQAIKLGGRPPAEWFLLSPNLQACLGEVSFPSAQVKAWDERCEKLDKYRTPRLQNKDRAKFLDLIRRMIITDPSSRQGMSELVQHPFLRG